MTLDELMQAFPMGCRVQRRQPVAGREATLGIVEGYVVMAVAEGPPVLGLRVQVCETGTAIYYPDVWERIAGESQEGRE